MCVSFKAAKRKLFSHHMNRDQQPDVPIGGKDEEENRKWYDDNDGVAFSMIYCVNKLSQV